MVLEGFAGCAYVYKVTFRCHLELPMARAEFLWFTEVSVGTSNIFFYKAVHTEYTEMLMEKQTFCSAGCNREEKALKK